MTSHGENVFPMRPRNEAGWQAALDLMTGKHLLERDRLSPYEGILARLATNFRFGLQDQKDVLAYLIANFGAGSRPRVVRSDKEIPLDEGKLGKARFVEYYLPPDPLNRAGVGSQPQGEIALSRNRIAYTLQARRQAVLSASGTFAAGWAERPVIV